MAVDALMNKRSVTDPAGSEWPLWADGGFLSLQDCLMWSTISCSNGAM